MSTTDDERAEERWFRGIDEEEPFSGRRCACVSLLARRCYCLRYAPDDTMPKDDVCECPCHEDDDDC